MNSPCKFLLIARFNYSKVYVNFIFEPADLKKLYSSVKILFAFIGLIILKNAVCRF
jgi:hypothetical protein